jgi:hypothetical protein
MQLVRTLPGMHSRPHRELPDGPARLGLQHAAGEDGAPTWPAKLGRFPVTVDASGDHGGLHAALRSSAPDRTCTSVAIYFKLATPVPLLEMYTGGCTLHMWYSAAGPAGGGRLPVVEEWQRSGSPFGASWRRARTLAPLWLGVRT